MIFMRDNVRLDVETPEWEIVWFLILVVWRSNAFLLNFVLVHLSFHHVGIATITVVASLSGPFDALKHNLSSLLDSRHWVCDAVGRYANLCCIKSKRERKKIFLDSFSFHFRSLILLPESVRVTNCVCVWINFHFEWLFKRCFEYF